MLLASQITYVLLCGATAADPQLQLAASIAMLQLCAPAVTS
jgi:hypothetical protein